MSISQAYNQWAATYDGVVNKTRDIEAKALREIFATTRFDRVLEAGCGTGKNTEWFARNAGHVTATDFSQEMLSKAQEKVGASNVDFVRFDLNAAWAFQAESYDLVSFSLVLEHIAQLEILFQKVSTVLKQGGSVYLGELHPFKQYSGSKARFENQQGEIQMLECYTHHVSDYFSAAAKAGLRCEYIGEWFDHDNENIPRLLTMVFTKP